MSISAEKDKTSIRHRARELNPTLFISLGGSGVEVLSRLRRDLLLHNWGDIHDPLRLQNLSDFPLAEFIHFDLDQGSMLRETACEVEEISRSGRFSKSESIVSSLSLRDLFEGPNPWEQYPHIRSWFPLDESLCRKLNTDQSPSQIRAISRLYFFDQIDQIENMIRRKLERLHASCTDDWQALNKLNISVGPRAKVVLVCSLSGGTGAGSFLDMGWLASQIMREVYDYVDVQLIALLPTGSLNLNVARCDANAYASLMELDSAMRGGFGDKYVGSWRREKSVLEFEDKPFSDVYLIEALGGMPGASTYESGYQMIADVLLEELSDDEFLRAKYCNFWAAKQPHKHGDFPMEVVDPRFEGLYLPYPRPYLSFGLARIDVMLNERLALIFNAWTVDVLRTLITMAATNETYDRLRDTGNDETSTEAHSTSINDEFSSSVDMGRIIIEQVITKLEAESEFIEAQLAKQQFSLLPIKIEALEITQCEQNVISELVNLVLHRQGGATDIFLKLQDSAAVERLMDKTRTVVAAEVAKRYDEGVQGDPLFNLLDEMKDDDPTKLERLFNSLIVQAMPRIELGANTTSWRPDKGQFRLLMCVNNSREFEQKFGSIVCKANNTGVELLFCDSSHVGRLQIYADLHGFPAGAVTQLESLYGRYVYETQKVLRRGAFPLHNIVDFSLFTHPKFPSTKELHVFADDFKLFQLSIIFGLLVRRNDRSLSSGGIYSVEFEYGEWLNLISEPMLRQDGLDFNKNKKNILTERIGSLTGGLNAVQRMAALGLITHLKEKVYQRPVFHDECGEDKLVDTFPYFCLRELEAEWQQVLVSKSDVAVSNDDIKKMLRGCREDWNKFMQGWTEEVLGSESEVYEHEILSIDREPSFLRKRKVLEVFFDAPDKLTTMLDSYLPETLKRKPIAPPALPQVEVLTYYLAIEGQASGPFTLVQLAPMVQTGKLSKTTLCWKQGTPNWVEAHVIKDLDILWSDLPPSQLIN